MKQDKFHFGRINATGYVNFLCTYGDGRVETMKTATTPRINNRCKHCMQIITKIEKKIKGRFNYGVSHIANCYWFKHKNKKIINPFLK